jgi:hypothetical protein
MVWMLMDPQPKIVNPHVDYHNLLVSLFEQSLMN